MGHTDPNWAQGQIQKAKAKCILGAERRKNPLQSKRPGHVGKRVKAISSKEPSRQECGWHTPAQGEEDLMEGGKQTVGSRTCDSELHSG